MLIIKSSIVKLVPCVEFNALTAPRETGAFAIAWLAALSGPPKLGVPSVLTTLDTLLIIIWFGLVELILIPVPPTNVLKSIAEPSALACGTV